MRYAVKRAVKFFFFCNCLLVFLYKNKKLLYKFSKNVGRDLTRYADAFI